MMEGLTAAAPEGGTPQLCGADIEMEVLEGKLGLVQWIGTSDRDQPFLL